MPTIQPPYRPPLCEIAVPLYLRENLNRYIADIATKAFEAGKIAGEQLVLARAKLAADQRPAIRNIQQAVADRFGVTLDDLDSDRRSHGVSHPRQVAMYLSTRLTSHSTTVIGRHFRRDHTTVWHAIRVVEARCRADPETDAKVRGLYQELSAA